ncbi:MAG: shikimate dehydrogenase [Pseudomonadota bacterium]|jgi:shikimate dehydrogenase|nr:shikimate dehydrogenase [Pseudomonadota bacterium]
MSNKKPLLAAVLGNPISHSKSPRMHNYWLKQNKIEGYYIPIKVEDNKLEETIYSLKDMGFSGANVTIPHKVKALDIAHQSSKRAQDIGAANTLTFTEAGSIYADNTDGYGFINNIKSKYTDWIPGKGSSLVLGAGGASRAVVAALLEQGSSDVIVLNRTIERAQELRDKYDKRVRVEKWSSLNEIVATCNNIINTTSLGMNDETAININPEAISEKALISDLVYTPLETNLLKIAKNRKIRFVDGLGMLIHQGVPGFEAWFGKTPLITEDLRELLLQ